MKSHFVQGLIVIVLLLSIAAPGSIFGATAPHLSDKEAAKLLQSATTPAEHRLLAEYLHQHAKRMRDKEEYYLEMSANYRLHPPRVDAYRNTPLFQYYAQLANEAKGRAEADDRLAKFQLQLAEGNVTKK